MIFDKLENIHTYANIHPRFKVAFDWLKTADINAMITDEKVFIDERNIYAVINEYETTPAYKVNFEGHKKYADVQIILEGAELMEVAFLNGTEEEVSPYNEKDKYKVKAQADTEVIVKANEFAVFFPNDLHKPCVNPGYNPSKIKKLLIKVLL